MRSSVSLIGPRTLGPCRNRRPAIRRPGRFGSGILPSLALLAFLFSTSLPAQDERERAQEQLRLDTACEVARQKRLVPERKKMVEECVETGERESREACERFYADYGNRAGNRPGLYYDLPECEAAFEYRRSYRTSG